MIRPAAPATDVPVVVQLSLVSWLTAVAAGMVETLVRLGLPGPPTTGQLAVRFGAYAIFVVPILALRTGHNTIRWTLTVLLGGVCTLSLVTEPLSWLLAGGSPAEFLTTADGSTLLIAGLRAVHTGAVLVALVLMFQPAANAFFRATGAPNLPPKV